MKVGNRIVSIPGSVWLLGTVTANPSGWYSFRDSDIYSNTCANHYSTDSRNHSLRFSLLSSTLAISSCLDLPVLSVLFPQLRKLVESIPESLLTLSVWKLSQSCKLGNRWAHFICLPSLRDHCLSLTDIQCHDAIISYILCVVLPF